MTKTETAQERFWREGPDRVQDALSALAQVADMAAPDFEYNEDECQQILDALFDAIHSTKRALQSKIARKQRFRFE